MVNPVFVRKVYKGGYYKLYCEYIYHSNRILLFKAPLRTGYFSSRRHDQFSSSEKEG